MPVIFIDASSSGVGASGISGSGVSGQVSVFNGANTIGGYPGLTFNPLTGLSLLGSLSVAGDVISLGGIANPSTALTATLVNSPGNIDTDTFDYVVTFVTTSGHETYISSASNSVTISNNAVAGQIALSNIPVSTNPEVVARKIYRENTTFAVYELVTTINNNTTTTFTDNLSNASIPGNSAPSVNQTGAIAITGPATFSNTADFNNVVNFAQAVTFNSSIDFGFLDGVGTIDGASDTVNFPKIDLTPISPFYNCGLRILPGGGTYTGDLVQIFDQQAGNGNLKIQIDQYGHLISGNALSGVTPNANIYITAHQTNSSYGLRLLQGCLARFDDIVEFTKATGFITAGKYQIGVDVADVLRINAPNGTGINYSINGVDIISHRAVSPLTITQSVQSGNGTVFLFSATGAAHLNLTASTEKIDFFVDLARSVQHATGALTTQRGAVFTAPTYTFVGASTISDAATFAITAAPTAGTNATITRSMALWVQAGTSRFDGRILGFSAAITAANDLTLGAGNQNVVSGNTQITAILTAGWMAGSIVSLIFSGTPTVKHNTAGGAGTAKIFLAGSVDFVAAANSVLTLEYDGTQWQEKSRKVA